jgi:hypothetical protein
MIVIVVAHEVIVVVIVPVITPTIPNGVTGATVHCRTKIPAYDRAAMEIAGETRTTHAANVRTTHSDSVRTAHSAYVGGAHPAAAYPANMSATAHCAATTHSAAATNPTAATKPAAATATAAFGIGLTNQCRRKQQAAHKGNCPH